MSSRTFSVWFVTAMVFAVGCGPTVTPRPPVVTCAPIAKGKIIHLAEVQDWRKDGLGSRDFGQSVKLDSELTVASLTKSSMIASCSTGRCGECCASSIRTRCSCRPTCTGRCR